MKKTCEGGVCVYVNVRLYKHTCTHSREIIEKIN